MDEQNQAQEFNALLDSILAGNDVSLDASELSKAVKLASYLHGIDLSANTFAFQRDIRERLTPQNKEKILMKRKKLLIGIALLVTIGLIVLSPAGTYAQSVLRSIGGVTLSTQEAFPKEEQESAATRIAEMNATMESGLYPTPKPGRILNEDVVQKLAGFPGWRPKFVPEDYTLYGYNVAHDNFGHPFVSTHYLQENNHLFGFFHIDQSVTIARESITGNWNVGDAPVRNVFVNGEEAVFVEKAKIMPPPGANLLIWTTNEYTFTMIAGELDQITMIAVAESMQAP